MFCLYTMPLFFSEYLPGFSKQYFLWFFENPIQCILNIFTSPLPLINATFPPFYSFPHNSETAFFLLFPCLVQFVWPSESWEWGLPWHGVILLWVTFLQKTDSSSPSDHQMCITPWLLVRLCSLFPVSVLGLCLTGAWAGLTYAATVAMWSYVNLSSRV